MLEKRRDEVQPAVVWAVIALEYTNEREYTTVLMMRPYNGFPVQELRRR